MRRLKIGTGGNMPDTNEFQRQLKAAGLSDDVRVKKAKDFSEDFKDFIDKNGEIFHFKILL